MANASTSVVKDQKRYSLRGLKILGRGFSAALIPHHVERELLALNDSVHASALDSGDVNEHVRRAVIWRDEAVAFGGIEKLYGSDGHDDSLSIGIESGHCRN
jgi:hypothetical protein